jgi:hypothetical protein
MVSIIFIISPNNFNFCYIYQALTLNEHPNVNFAFPPVGLHKIVLQLKINEIPFTLDYSLCMTENGGQCCTTWTLDIHKV